MEPVVYADIRKNWTGAGVLDLQNKKQKDKQKHLKKTKQIKTKKEVKHSPPVKYQTSTSCSGGVGVGGGVISNMNVIGADYILLFSSS